MRRRVVWAGVTALAAGAVVTAVPAQSSSSPESACEAPDGGYDQVTADVEHGVLDPYLAGEPATVKGRKVDDPLFPHQWNLRMLNVPAAWKLGATGEGQRIAIVDTGVDPTHPDLLPQLLPGEAFLVEGSDEQAAVDDDCPSMPVDGHGTTVAGLAAAATGNGIGIAGVAPDARIVPVRLPVPKINVGAELLEEYMDKFAEALSWAADNADVINFSGGQVTDNAKIRAAVAKAVEQGVTVVSIAYNLPGVCTMPGRMDGVICVSGVDRRGMPIAQHGLPTQVDPHRDPATRAPKGIGLRAPAALDSPTGTRLCESEVDSPAGKLSRPVLSRTQQLWTTVRPGTRQQTSCSPWKGYNLGGATSQAAPQVAGIAALLRSEGLTAEQVLTCLAETSSNDGTWDPVMGFGIPDAGRAVKECPRMFRGAHRS